MARMEEREMFVREQLEKCPLLLNPTNPPEILVSFDHVTIYPGNYRKKWTWPKNSLDAEAKVIGLLVMICDWDRDNQNPGKVAVAECVHVTYLQYGGKIAGEAIVKRKDYATESALSDAFHGRTQRARRSIATQNAATGASFKLKRRLL